MDVVAVVLVVMLIIMLGSGKKMPENTKETQIQEESRWYILHTYSGHEDKVSENLKQRIENLDLSKTIHEVLVPSEVKLNVRFLSSVCG